MPPIERRTASCEWFRGHPLKLIVSNKPRSYADPYIDNPQYAPMQPRNLLSSALARAHAVLRLPCTWVPVSHTIEACAAVRNGSSRLCFVYTARVCRAVCRATPTLRFQECSTTPFPELGAAYAFGGYSRAPKMLEPTRTELEPALIAASKSPLIPIESSSVSASTPS